MFRKRGFRGKRTFRRRPRYEVAQVSRTAQASVSPFPEGGSRGVPFGFDIYLIGQYGLARTGRDTATGTESLPVLDSGVRGISIHEVIYSWDVHAEPTAGGTGTQNARFTVECADALYVSDLAAQSVIDTTVVPAPDRPPNLWGNEVGSQFLGTTTDSVAGGAFSEVFDFPDRILFRRWGNMSCTQFNSADNPGFLDDAPIQSMKYQSPLDYGMKRIKRKAFLRDSQGLFCRTQLVSHSPGSVVNLAVDINAVIVYRVIR